MLFRSPIGIITGDQVDYYRVSLRKHTHQTDFDVTNLTDLPRVDMVTTFIDNDSVAIDAFIAAGAKGIALAAAGGGALTPGMRAGLQRAMDAGIIMVMSTRTGSGTIRGMNPENVSKGLVAAGNLNPYKARILLAVALAHSNDPKQIQEWFNSY